MSDKTKVVSIEQRVAARIAAEEQRDKEAREANLDGGSELSSHFVLSCLNANELGDGILFAAINEGKYIYDMSSGEWFSWGGNFWIKDLRAFETKGAVEKVCEAFLVEANAAMARVHKANAEGNGKAPSTNADDEQRKALYRRVSRLRSCGGRVSCLEFAASNSRKSLAINGEVFDKDPWVLACPNGVVDLRTGEIRKGTADEYITKASPVNWEGIDCPAPAWEKFLDEILAGDAEMVAYVQRLMGYATTGLTTEHILPIFWGQGRNGKGTFVETLMRVMGQMAAQIESETLLDSGKPRSSTGPSPDTMALRGLRMAFASETDTGRKISPARVKWLSGGDTLVGRNPYDRYPVYFRPTHTLFLQTNDKPAAPADDYAFWKRVHLISFTLSFVENPTAPNERMRDENLPAKLQKELPGILAWLVRGCLEWQRIGLTPPSKVKEATSEYRHEEDILGQFIDEFVVLDPASSIKASDFYTEFNEWYKETQNKRGMSQTRFGKLASKRFNKQKEGTYRYYGLRMAKQA